MSRRKPLPTTHRLAFGPDFANSSRFHSTPFQRRPVNHSTGPRFHSTPLHRLKSPKTGRPRRHERASFRQVPSAGRPRIRSCRNFRPHSAPKISPTSGRSRQAAGLTPAHHPPGDGPRLTRPPEVGTARPPRPGQGQQPSLSARLPDRLPIGKGPGSRPLA
jgi:hypothetical protein